MEEIKEQVELVTDAESINDLLSRLGEFQHIGSSMVAAKVLINNKAKVLGLVPNKETKTYEKPAA